MSQLRSFKESRMVNPASRQIVDKRNRSIFKNFKSKVPENYCAHLVEVANVFAEFTLFCEQSFPDSRANARLQNWSPCHGFSEPKRGDRFCLSAKQTEQFVSSIRTIAAFSEPLFEDLNLKAAMERKGYDYEASNQHLVDNPKHFGNEELSALLIYAEWILSGYDHFRFYNFDIVSLKRLVAKDFVQIVSRLAKPEPDYSILPNNVIGSKEERFAWAALRFVDKTFRRNQDPVDAGRVVTQQSFGETCNLSQSDVSRILSNGPPCVLQGLIPLRGVSLCQYLTSLSFEYVARINSSIKAVDLFWDRDKFEIERTFSDCRRLE